MHIGLPDFTKAFLETVWMVLGSGCIAVFLGFILGTCTFYTRPEYPWHNRVLYTVLNTLINVGRSVPFIILMIAVIPFTRWLVGTSIGTQAALVPLALAATAFYARLTESAFLELPLGLHDLSASLGASPVQSLRWILFPEARPALVSGAILTGINLVGYSAMAGAVGGGGLGSLAIHYGYQRFDGQVMLLTVMLLIGLVQGMQAFGDWWVKRLLHPY